MARLVYYLKMTRFKRNLLEESDLDPRCLIKRRYKWFYMYVCCKTRARFVCLFVFVALPPMSTAMVIAGRSVHLTTPFPGQA